MKRCPDGYRDQATEEEEDEEVEEVGRLLITNLGLMSEAQQLISTVLCTLTVLTPSSRATL